MRRLVLMPLFLVIVLAIVIPNAYAMSMKTFVFVDRFPDEAESLGFATGTVLQVGAYIKPGDSPITEVTARNLDTGLVLTPTSTKIGTISPGLYLAYSPFDPSKHMGAWKIRAKDEKGNELVSVLHKLNKEGEMPYVGNIKASGTQLAPTITWTAPRGEDIPAGCKIGYRVRLLKAADSQFYRAKEVIYDTKHKIPEGVLTSKDIPDTFVRIECQCLDKDLLDMPGCFPIALRSETFLPLKEALGLGPIK